VKPIFDTCRRAAAPAAALINFSGHLDWELLENSTTREIHENPTRRIRIRTRTIQRFNDSEEPTFISTPSRLIHVVITCPFSSSSRLHRDARIHLSLRASSLHPPAHTTFFTKRVPRTRRLSRWSNRLMMSCADHAPLGLRRCTRNREAQFTKNRTTSYSVRRWEETGIVGCAPTMSLDGQGWAMELARGWTSTRTCAHTRTLAWTDTRASPIAKDRFVIRSVRDVEEDTSRNCPVFARCDW